MAGNRRFSMKRLQELRRMVRRRKPGLTKSQVDEWVWRIDMAAYRMFGKSLTGSAWRKGRKYPYPCTAKGERR